MLKITFNELLLELAQVARISCESNKDGSKVILSITSKAVVDRKVFVALNNYNVVINLAHIVNNDIELRTYPVALINKGEKRC